VADLVGLAYAIFEHLDVSTTASVGTGTLEMRTPIEFEKALQPIRKWHEVKGTDAAEPGDIRPTTKPGAVQ
jgi:hypothetical protein